MNCTLQRLRWDDLTVVKDKHFESGIVKLQDNRESELSAAEKVELRMFLKNPDDDDATAAVVQKVGESRFNLHKRQRLAVTDTCSSK
jgi:outer membrane lipoprotein SlyB